MNNETVQATRTRKRLNTPFLNIAEEKSVIGKVAGNFEIKYSKTWESNFVTFDFAQENGEIVSLVLDGGLRGALKMAGIIAGDVTQEEKEITAINLSVAKPDTLIEIEFVGKIEVANGKANQYNVYELE